jgi:hypothetical protein
MFEMSLLECISTVFIEAYAKAEARQNNAKCSLSDFEYFVVSSGQ